MSNSNGKKTAAVPNFVLFGQDKTGFPLTICTPEKHLYENKENLQMYANVKLGCSPNYDGFEANFKKVV